ncbi:MAG TPA: hypothetical protein VFH68_23715 [Polyangia bacterium]|nr:hypothetical protein [Polyangia bacterium]
MTRARGITLALGAAAAELAATLALAGGPSAAALVLALALHGVCVLLAARLLDGVARACALPPVTPVAVVAALFLPVVGPLGLGLLLRAVGRRARAAAAGLPPRITLRPELPPAAPAPARAGEANAAGAGGATAAASGGNDGDPHGHLGPGALSARLRFAREPDARVRAVLATRRLDGARAAPLLRAALRDQHEDVRLLAYALLEDRERQGDATIRALLAALPLAAPQRRATLHEQLAHAYWELCYQQLVAGELEAFALARALEHLDAAAGDLPERSGARWLLRGRILLRQGAGAGARAALEESRRCGMPARTVDPYLAETRYLQRAAAPVTV